MRDKETLLTAGFHCSKHVVDIEDNTELLLEFSVGSFSVKRMQSSIHKDFSGVKIVLNKFISS